jgi:hypothetical protein
MKRVQPAMTVLALAALLAAGMMTPASAADFSSWQRKMQVTFAGYNPPGGVTTLTNFPALVVLSTNISKFSYGDFQSLTNQDLRFADANGNELNYEIESWNTNGASYVWLQVTNLVDTNTFVWAYWGMTGQTAPVYTTNGTTWSKEYVGVWHLGEASGTRFDSTTNHNDLTPTSFTSGEQVNATVGKGVQLSNSKYLTKADNASLRLTNAVTMSGWLTPNSLGSGYSELIAKRGSVSAAEYGINGNSSAGFQQFYANSNAFSTLAMAPILSAGTVYYIACTRSAAQYLRNYENARAAGASAGLNTPVVTTAPLNLGSYNNGSELLNGVLDEVRLESVERSSNWVWACYMNMATNGVLTGSFNNYSAVQTVASALPQVSNVGSQNLKDISADVVGNLITNGTSAATVYLYWATNDCMTNASAWTAGGNVRNLGVQANGAIFTNTLTGLASNTTYYWNYSASNSAGTAWSATTGSPWFKTYGPPAVNNGGGATTNIGPYAAALHGMLTNGVSASATIYCGSDTNNWTYTNVIGTVTEAQGIFSTNQTGLARNTTYYYSVLVSNLYGTAQSPVTNFTTLPDLWITASTTSTESQTNLYGGVPVTVSGAGVVLTLSNSPTYGNLPVYQFGSLLVTNGASIVCLGQSSGSAHDANARGVAIQVAGDLIIAGGNSTNSIHADGMGFASQTGPGGASSSGSMGGTHGGLGLNNTNATYGSVTNPTCLGSGGTSANGGGAIKLIVNGNLIVNGRLSANGLNSTATTGGGGGAGGSIWITGGCTLGGTGEVQVSGGGSGTSASYAGGGGRLSIDDTVMYNFHGNIRSANGSQEGSSVDGYPPGDIVDTWGNAPGSGGPGSIYFGALARQNFTVYSNQFIIVGNDIVNVFSNLTVYGTLVPGGCYVGLGTGAVLQANNITIAPGGQITADGWGFAGNTGPGAGAPGTYFGGNHGGRAGGNTNILYGSITNPTSMGSGGNGASGGGAIKLKVSGTLTINGLLSANGNIGHNSPSGAGGSIWITGGGTVNGTGAIRAYGVANGGGFGTGGGGRISIDDTMTYAFTGNIQAGTTVYDGTPGTLYLPASARNNFLIDTNQTFIIGNGISYSFGNLTVKGMLDCGGDSWLTPGGTGIVITANNLTIWTNATLKADCRGFYGTNAAVAWVAGPGAGGAAIGGTHGGMGYNNTTGTYGSATQPTTLGSGAYSVPPYTPTSSNYFGGGAIKLTVANLLTIYGTLSANGSIKAGYGGSAGGSLWIDAGTLAGNGRIQANGGAGTYGGGGGRIAVYYHSASTFSGLPTPGLYASMESVSSNVTVMGGYNVGFNGPEDGSIYIAHSVPGGMAVFFR